MKSKFFLLAVSFLIAAGAYAQNNNGSRFSSKEDSIRCITNNSLFTPSAKSGNFKDAYPFWKIVYDEFPWYTKNIYIYGVDIINWQISQETDAAKKEALIDEMMKLYDNRIKHFGNDASYRKDRIIANKAQSYNLLKGDKTDQTVIYKWLGDAINEYKENTYPLAISLYMFSSFKLMQGDMDKYKAQYVEDFLKCSAILDEQIAAAQGANNEKDAESLLARKTEIEQNFAGSGAADCETLQSIYASKVEEKKSDLNFLKETMTLLRRVGCNESDLYITASEYVHKIVPTAESAMGLGTKAFNEKDYATAEKYYNEAIEMTEDKEIKALLYYSIAAMANQQGQYSKAKQQSLKSLTENPNYGRAYMLIASIYAASAKSIYPDDNVKYKCVFHAVIDKLERARQVDPTVAAEAGRQIARYKEALPSSQEIFMHPELSKVDKLTIGGLINETVKIK